MFKNCDYYHKKHNIIKFNNLYWHGGNMVIDLHILNLSEIV